MIRMNFRKKTKTSWRGAATTSCIFYLLTLSPVFAFRAEMEGESSRSKNENTPKRVALNDGTERILPSEKQTQIADDLKKSGFSVEWDGQLNSPVSIRGKGLGVAPVGGQRSVASVVSGTYAQRAVSVLKNLAPLYGIQDVSQELLPSGTEQKDELGFRHQRLRQVYLGLPVVGSDLKVHFDKSGNPYEVSGRLVPGIKLDPNPSITGDRAADFATADFINKGFARPKTTEQPKLVIYTFEGISRLAYQLVISDGGAHVYRYWVDAKTGSVINAINQVCSILPPSSKGRAATIRGTILAGEGGRILDLAGWSENRVYYMYDPASYNYVFNNAGTETAPPFPAMKSVNTVYPDSGTYAYRNSSDWGTSDPAEVSVAANIAYTMYYYKTIHGRKSVDDLGTVIPTVAHYGVDYVNAFWSGGDPGYMVFGDGDGVEANSLATLDVCGHEVTHGVTQHTADLVYQNESGALNESFSDIFGATIEFLYQTDNRSDYPKKKPGTADWLLGEDCWLSATAMRDMRNPANVATVGAGNQQPSKYKGAYWYTGALDSGGVHQNSGVQNFFYYLLCEGGSGTNDGISYQVNGITIANARQIAYRALTVYCSQNTGYKEVRNAWISAAQDLNASWVASVEAAWDAVGVVVGRITSSLTVSGVVNHPMSPYIIKVKSADSPTSYAASGLPPGLSIKGPTISGIPTQKGTFSTTISAQTSSEVISATMNFSISDPLPYDDFAQAKTFGPSIPANAAGTTVGYSKEVGELAHASGGPYSSIWFKLNANQTGVVTLSTAGSDFDTTLAIYKGSELSKLTKVAANNDAGVGIRTSLLQFSMEAGTTYYIAIDGNGGATGAYVLTATGSSLSQAPANDMASSPTNLGNGVSFTRSGSILAATAQSGEPSLAGLPATRSVWFTYTAPANGQLVVDTIGSDFNSVLGVYSGTIGVFSSLKLLAANDDIATGNFQSSVSLPVTSGTTYIIKVDGRKSSSGSYTLRGTFSLPLPSCPAPATATFTMTKVAGTTTYRPSVTWSVVTGPVGYPVTAYEVQLIFAGQAVVNSGSLSAATLSYTSTALPKLGYTARVRAIAGPITGAWREVPAKVSP